MEEKLKQEQLEEEQEDVGEGKDDVQMAKIKDENVVQDRNGDDNDDNTQYEVKEMIEGGVESMVEVTTDQGYGIAQLGPPGTQPPVASYVEYTLPLADQREEDSSVQVGNIAQHGSCF